MKISGQLMASLISARVCKKKMPWTLYYHEDLQWNTKKDWKSAIFNKREYASENVYNQRGEGICMRDYFFFIGVIFAFEDTDTVTYIICWLRRKKIIEKRFYIFFLFLDWRCTLKDGWVPGKPCCEWGVLWTLWSSSMWSRWTSQSMPSPGCRKEYSA